MEGPNDMYEVPSGSVAAYPTEHPLRIRPITVVLLSALALMGAVSGLAIVFGPSVASGGSLIDILARVDAVIGGATMLVSAFYTVVAYGLWAGRLWGWVLAVPLGVAGLVFGLISIAIGTYYGLVGVSLNLALLYCLKDMPARMFYQP